jgi:hypothetical protein
MHRFFIDDRASCGPVTADEPFVAIYRYWTVMRTELEFVTSLETYYGVICLAKLAGSFNNGLEDRPTSVGEDAITLRMFSLPV